MAGSDRAWIAIDSRCTGGTLIDSMAGYTKRVQILLTDEQHDFLTGLAELRRRSVGDLVRSAFEEVYRPAHSIRELQALSALEQHSYIEETPAEIFQNLAASRFS